MRELDWPGQFDFGDAEHRYNLTNMSDFTYGHFQIGSGYATIGGGVIDSKLYYGISFCSPEDNFSKKTGRNYVVSHLESTTYGHLRGVFTLADYMKDAQPAIVLQNAVDRHLLKMRDRKPQWAKGMSVEFRGKRRTVGEVTDWIAL